MGLVNKRSPSEEIAFQTLSSNNKFLYETLEDNVLKIRGELLVQGHPKEIRAALYESLTECRTLQLKLIARGVQSSEDTQAVEIKPFKKN